MACGQEDTENAALAVLNGRSCKSVAASMGVVPKSTIIRKVNMKKDQNRNLFKKPAASTIFSADQKDDSANTFMYTHA